MPLKPHADLPHLRLVRLADAPPVEVLHPTWLQLAEAGFRVDDRVHVATAALRMRVTAQVARQQLGRAYSVLGNPARRTAKAFDVACDVVQVRRHTVRVPKQGTRPQRFTTDFCNGHRMGLMEPPTAAEYRQMGREKVIDEGDSLRRRMLEQEAALQDRSGDPNWSQLPKSAMRDIPYDVGTERSLTMRISTDERGDIIGFQEVA